MAPKAAKAVGKAPSKVAGKAPAKPAAKPATRGKSPAPPSPPPPPTEDSAKKLPEPADAETLSAKQAEELLAGLMPEAVIALAETADEAEQLPARMALEYVGDKDLSWANAQSSLRTGSQLLKEMLEMQSGEFITRQSYQRFQELGRPDLAVLRGKNRAAYVLALFLQACLREARDRLGLEPPPPPPPELPDEPPQWPLVIGFKERNNVSHHPHILECSGLRLAPRAQETRTAPHKKKRSDGSGVARADFGGCALEQNSASCV